MVITSQRSAVELQETSNQSWDALRFNFVVTALYNQNTENGRFSNNTIRLRIRVYKFDGVTEIFNKVKVIVANTTNEIRIVELFNIPVEDRDERGYKFTIEKISEESSSTSVRDDIFMEGWDEIEKAPFSYPGTALIGYALKATDKYSGTVPNITCVVKGIKVKVPVNYNQPVIYRADTNDYEIDWRELETNTDERANTAHGISLENNPTIRLTGDDAKYPTLYSGVWTGEFKTAWTENPAWLIYHLLTDKKHGLGINESYVDKWSFYRAGQYCDDVNPENGKFISLYNYLWQWFL